MKSSWIQVVSDDKLEALQVLIVTEFCKIQISFDLHCAKSYF